MSLDWPTSSIELLATLTVEEGNSLVPLTSADPLVICSHAILPGHQMMASQHRS